jgi:hypothetical protein
MRQVAGASLVSSVVLTGRALLRRNDVETIAVYVITASGCDGSCDTAKVAGKVGGVNSMVCGQ